MVKLHTDVECWTLEDLCDIRGAEFLGAISFTDLDGERFVFPVPELGSECDAWQIDRNEFVVLTQNLLSHILLSYKEGTKVLSKIFVEKATGLFDGAFFYFEDFLKDAHIYSVANRLEIRDVFRNLVDPEIHVVVEKDTRQIKVEVPYLTARFILVEPTSDGCSVETCLELCGSTSPTVTDFDSFVKLARERYEEVKIANYYEKCGGYYLGGSDEKVSGLFTEKKNLAGDSVYTYLPINNWGELILPKLIEKNHYIPVLPKYGCSFLGCIVDDKDYTIKLSRDILIISNHIGGKDRIYALEMHGENCVGVCRTGKHTFLAITEKPQDGISMENSLLKIRCFVVGLDSFYWDYSPYRLGVCSYINPYHCQMTRNVILVMSEPKQGPHVSYKIYYILENDSIDLIKDFSVLLTNSEKSYIAWDAKQILVRPKKGIEPRMMIAVRLYLPRRDYDVIALVDPRQKYRVCGKIYSTLINGIIKRGPKTVRGLVKMFEENYALQQKYPLW